MNKKGPIIVIEDDPDDKEFMIEAFKILSFDNEIIYFEDGEKALEHLLSSTIEPFIIISDINMPRLNGLALKEQIQSNEGLRLKCIPYLFFTTSGNQEYLIEAYSKSVQGFFIKPNSHKKLTDVIRRIVEYWLDCESPNYTK